MAPPQGHRNSESILEEMTLSILCTATNYFGPETGITTQEIRSAIQDAVIATDQNYGVAAAVEWGGGLYVPSRSNQRGREEFSRGGVGF
jgi:hypothetical protein